LADLTQAAASDPSRRVMWAASSEGVELSWAAVSGVSEYRVSRDGRLLTVVRGTHYRDQGVRPGTEVQYVVESVDPPKARVDFPGRTWGLSVSVPKTSSSDAVGMQAAAAVKQAAAVAPAYTIATYETFIPQQYIAVPIVGCSYHGGYWGHSFTGDNRGWGTMPGSSFKTKSTAFVLWNEGGRLIANNYVGATHVVSTRTHQLVATKTASASGLSITRMKGNSSQAELAFRIHAQNPFCGGPQAIDAGFNMVVTRSGSFTILSGWHKLMPNHQLWIATNLSRAWTRAYARSYFNELCLINNLCPPAALRGTSGRY